MLTLFLALQEHKKSWQPNYETALIPLGFFDYVSGR